MKPRIFIGSSKEGLNVAEKIKDFFSDEYECFLWTDNIFKYNENFLETLMKEASLFDFGFMVFTQDDHTISRKQDFATARDNVIFEYGLFLGRLGRDKAYVIKDQSVKLPSDLLGITIADFNCTKDVDDSLIIDDDSLIKTLSKLKLEIQEKIELGFLGMLPSTVLAIGYFYNFIQLVCDSIGSGYEMSVNGKNYTNAKLKIVLPKDLDSDLKKKATIYHKKNSFEQLQIETKHRQYPLYVSIDSHYDSLILSDMPTTLNGIDKAIDMYLRVGHIGKSTEQKLLEERELRNFEMVLRKLVANDAFCKEFVEFITEP
ncbi:putative nucleotide-binding protein with TIR-like domain [Dysgonomonas alginatilytica]|uniref:CD-NTase-associated protein 12 n=1 Tax=Dysgonomonas alginatilytica TaxID=1605892 RepID=A0A2V3PL99_9BACT|nr:STING domain-containing protein [Dysgonomonas alginatilytica]PXV60118.1 putative nucleotide-binding protein with TIR-like domain [Dysgonomonas alginatilytica]